MAKLMAIGVVGLLALLGAVMGQAADTSRTALAFSVVIFTVALSVPAWLTAALVMERRRPRVVNHYDNRRIVIVPPPTDPAQVPQAGEPERHLTIR